jgi:transposase-like protein
MPGVRFSAEQRVGAVRLVAEATPQHESQWAAIESVAGKIGASAETVRKWVRGRRFRAAPGDDQRGTRGGEAAASGEC